MLIGLDIYVAYGLKHSKLEPNKGVYRKGQSVLNMLGLALAALCVITGFWHQQTVGWQEDKTMLAIAVIFAIIHLAYYLLRIWRHTTVSETEY